jgi:hypothetical protein
VMRFMRSVLRVKLRGFMPLFALIDSASLLRSGHCFHLPSLNDSKVPQHKHDGISRAANYGDDD